MEQVEQINQALAISGPEDFSADGVDGRVDIDGAFADAVIDSLGLAPEFTKRFSGKPVRLSRYGVLEIWVDGWYTEGSGVRKIVHTAARRLH